MNVANSRNIRYNAVGNTTPVGSYETGKNGHGLYDMGGNVWEWCLDWHSDTYYEQCYGNGTVIDPMGPSSGEKRVCRGGSWAGNEDYIDVALRSSRGALVWYKTLGFRIVCNP